MLQSIHHIAIICSDYERSKKFYTQVLGLEIIGEVYRADRQSYKLDLALNGHYIIELFSFPDPPVRVSRPEAAGLRHLAFEVEKLEPVIQKLTLHGITAESIRTDEFTGKRFTFFADPDGLPLELYEVQGCQPSSFRH
ncbi:MAG: VOC family protein [Chitinophagaceae bacterium]